MPYLHIVHGEDPSQNVLLDRPRSVLGRDKVCDIVLNAPDAPKKKRPVVSRKHAVIECTKGLCYIEDGDGNGAPSRNHTFVNDVKVAASKPVLLKDKDVIKICDFVCTYYEAAEPESPSSADASVSHDSSHVFLAQPADRLKMLLEISNRLSNTLELDLLLPQVVENLLQLFKQAERVFLILVDETTGALVPQIVKHRRPGKEPNHAFSVAIVKQCLKTVQGLLSNDVSKHFPSESVLSLALESVMCAPVWSQQGKAFGVLLLDSKNSKRKFLEEDLTLLMGVASQASIALANARFHRDALIRERLLRDLALAREVQRSFLPADVPKIPGYEFFARNQSALEVGGDYYDFIPLPGQRLGILLGDVAGKGVAAALVMARFSAEARAFLRTEPSLEGSVQQLNGVMQPLSLTDRYVTLVAMVLDPVAHTVTLVNAGHPPPLLLRKTAGSVEEATPRADAGLPLGVLDGYDYQAHQLALQPGDGLVLFSDGVTEAMNAQSEPLGTQRLRAVIQKANGSPCEVGTRILEAVAEHAAGCSQYDDITLVCLGRLA